MNKYKKVYFVIYTVVLLFTLYSCEGKETNLALSPVSKTNFSDTIKSISDIDESVRSFLNEPEKVFTEQKIPKNFRIIVLSNLAEYITNFYLSGNISKTKAEEYLDKVISISLCNFVTPNYEKNWGDKQLKNDGLFLGHFNIILGTYKFALKSDKHKILNSKISTHFKTSFLKEPTANIPSWNNSSLRFPADNAADLFSLYLFDKNFSDSLSKQAIKNWLLFINTKGKNENYNLHKSELSKTTGNSILPRGCALSFTIRYMGAFEPNEAKRLWENYQKEFLVEKNGIAGFREFPKGIEKDADVDSGPIILGVGTAASGFGLVAAKVMNDATLYEKILLSQSLSALLVKEKITNSILAKSIALNAEYFKNWF